MKSTEQSGIFEIINDLLLAVYVFFNSTKNKPVD